MVMVETDLFLSKRHSTNLAAETVELIREDYPQCPEISAKHAKIVTPFSRLCKNMHKTKVEVNKPKKNISHATSRMESACHRCVDR